MIVFEISLRLSLVQDASRRGDEPGIRIGFGLRIKGMLDKVMRRLDRFAASC